MSRAPRSRLNAAHQEVAVDTVGLSNKLVAAEAEPCS